MILILFFFFITCLLSFLCYLAVYDVDDVQSVHLAEPPDLPRLPQRAATDSALQDVNARVAELKDKAQTPVASAAVPVAAAPVDASAPVAAHPSPRCPQCAGVVQADDRFCEHCGHKLQ